MKRPEDEERKRREKETKRQRAIQEFVARPEPAKAATPPTTPAVITAAPYML